MYLSLKEPKSICFWQICVTYTLA